MLGSIFSSWSAGDWLLASAVAVAGVWDVAWRRIPNWLTLSLAVAGIAQRSWTDGWSGLGAAMAGMLVAASIFFVAYLFGGMGAGDVKLLGALGTWCGPAEAWRLVAATAAAGVVVAVGSVGARCAAHRSWDPWRRCLYGLLGAVVALSGIRRGLPEARHGQSAAGAIPMIPYGVAIAAGCWLWLLVLRSSRL
jgi:prepilin peptidase CpaA